MIYKRFLCVLCYLGVLVSYLFFYLRDGLAVGIGIIFQDDLPGQAFGDIDDDGAKEIGGNVNAASLLIPVEDVDDRQGLQLRLPVLDLQGLTIFRG